MITHTMEQGSPAWMELRLGKVTGSRIKDVFKTDNLSLIDKLIAESETGQSADESDYVSDAMQRGKDLESIAMAEYERIHDTKLTRVGFIQSERFPLLGMSPDGLRFEGDTEVGCLETKCPASKTHVQYLRMGLVPVDYRWQTWCPFLISDKIRWVDFMSFDPRVSKKPTFIIRTTREEIQEQLDVATANLEKFFAKLGRYHQEIMF